MHPARTTQDAQITFSGNGAAANMISATPTSMVKASPVRACCIDRDRMMIGLYLNTAPIFAQCCRSPIEFKRSDSNAIGGAVALPDVLQITHRTFAAARTRHRKRSAPADVIVLSMSIRQNRTQMQDLEMVLAFVDDFFENLKSIQYSNRD